MKQVITQSDDSDIVSLINLTAELYPKFIIPTKVGEPPAILNASHNPLKVPAAGRSRPNGASSLLKELFK